MTHIAARGRSIKSWLVAAAAIAALTTIAALAIWRDDILEALLDPRVPYAVYHPPPAPDYDRPEAWALEPPSVRGAPVFFLHPTTYNGGRDWNGAIGDRAAAALLARVYIPNYAAPFGRAGAVFAPRYRQASLYTSLTLFDDAVQARAFAYRDVDEAFDRFLARIGRETPFIIAGVEQGGTLAARLLRDRVESDPDLRRRLVAAYLIETAQPIAPAGDPEPLRACRGPDETSCLVAWISAPEFDLLRVRRIETRSLVWGKGDRLTGLNGFATVCVNPLLGAATEAAAGARRNLGAANATGLEWGARPGFMARQVGARCQDGILRVTRPRSDSLRPAGAFAERLRAPPFNLFWADIETDAVRRVAAWRGAPPVSAGVARPAVRPPIEQRS